MMRKDPLSSMVIGFGANSVTAGPHGLRPSRAGGVRPAALTKFGNSAPPFVPPKDHLLPFQIALNWASMLRSSLRAISATLTSSIDLLATTDFHQVDDLADCLVRSPGGVFGLEFLVVDGRRNLCQVAVCHP